MRIHIKLLSLMLILLAAMIWFCCNQPTKPKKIAVSYIEVTPSNVTLENGKTQQFTCIAFYSDESSQDVTNQANWSSLPAIAGNINETGLFTADTIKTGTEMITANYNGKQDYAMAAVIERIQLGKMVSVPEGEFTMGSDEGFSDQQPVHTVFLDSYYIGKYEVTNEEYAAYLNEALAAGEIQASNSTVTKDGDKLLDLDDSFCQISYTNGNFIVATGKENYPVIEVTWYGAIAYCEYYDMRLPTEAEWEKAARGTDGRPYPWGDDTPNASRCNFNRNIGHPVSVGQYSPDGNSPYGCCDMAGNVWEWCNDWHDTGYYSISPANNPQGPSSGIARVIRGGSWYSYDWLCRTSYRSKNTPGSSFNNLGFRVAMDSLREWD